LNEVVVIGYGTQKKATLSGSVATVKGVEIAKSPAMNVTNSLSSIPGLVAVGQSGEPGSDYSTLYIRGRSTLNDNSPLVVIDGVPNRSLERIDPSTIESVTVLKDASAAIYGSQAANGVILVTTKRGAIQRMTITASYNEGWAQPTRIPKLTNSAEYATLVNEVDLYDHKNPTIPKQIFKNFRMGAIPGRIRIQIGIKRY
jgi:TonB-dependent SusC/RagA subfamily outer membrane receptor